MKKIKKLTITIYVVLCVLLVFLLRPIESLLGYYYKELDWIVGVLYLPGAVWYGIYLWRKATK